MDYTATATDLGDLPDDPAEEERRLVELARHDRGAFAQLYRRHYAEIGRYLMARTGDVHETEDLLAETFLAAMKGIRGYRPRGIPVRWWLYRIASNAAKRRHRKRPVSSVGFDCEEWPDDPRVATDTAALRAEECALARRLLQRVPPRFQEVLTLRYLQDLELAEIAAILGCRPGTVKSRLSRAREALRRVAREES